MEKNELIYWLATATIPGIGPVRFKRLVNYFTSLKDFFAADRSELLAAGVENWLLDAILAGRREADGEKEWSFLTQEGIEVVTFLDDKYPARLKEIYDFPPLLYYRGDLTVLQRLSLAVVGSRRPSPYGAIATQTLVADLARAGVAVVSGLAFGIDSLAHQAALSVGGATVAVLGNGLARSVMYPREHQPLAEAIVAAGGLLLSEFPVTYQAQRQNFPLRNRLLSGVSAGAVVVEAGEKSGALITAQCALDQNREVFAVPGNIDQPLSVGPNQLIKAGARVATNAADILEVFNLTSVVEHATIQELQPQNAAEAALLPLLSRQPQQIDDLISVSGLDSQTVNATLSCLELDGKVRDVGGRRYILN